MMILGIDVGGTHTDAVLIDHFRLLKKVKVPTDEKNLLASLLQATTALLADQDPGKLDRVVLSTTLSTNAIVQKKTARVGMILVSGPGLPPALLPIPDDTVMLPGYINNRGIEVAAIDTEALKGAARRFAAEGIRHLGIVGKFSTRNPHQEVTIKETLADDFQHCSLGHRLSGHLNFPRRIATTYLNEAVWDRYNRFVQEIMTFVGQQGIHVPIYILKADGGTFEIGRSTEFPVETILSGPAASIMGILATASCREDAIALDIGGTTTDIAIFADGIPLMEPFGVTIESHKTLIRGLQTRSIGVGGDSRVVWNGKEIRIGPEREGPAAAFGGPFPTPTDAMIVLGLTAIGDAPQAAAAIGDLAGRMGCPPAEAARRIVEETCRKIASRVTSMIEDINNKPVYTIHEMLEGKKLNPKALYVVGGPAPALAPRIAELLGCTYRIPEHAEVANAIGAALARTTAEMTILADTEQKTLTIAEEGLQMTIPARFSLDDAVALGRERLTQRALQMGAKERDLEIEVIESQVFNMVRGYSTSGKNIRVKLQVKPGLIAGYGTGGAS